MTEMQQSCNFLLLVDILILNLLNSTLSNDPIYYTNIIFLSLILVTTHYCFFFFCAIINTKLSLFTLLHVANEENAVDNAV